ncbi:alcohol dehydrogenase [Exophiala viscosa]|uniref:Alcohol dehydrogenase n=1 Tax=Exophiala viscosa TaxID=2486360 RepID=A0AAN6DVX0_9EURO|nr:alcohol dehydrogenase [Exophiala viscosa]KAI1623346.1 alcohol dehydrogenase [Exophiala viscosa]
MGYPETFEGFMIEDQSQGPEFKRHTFKPKTFGDYDVDIKIECCGVCGSDVHTITGGWGAVPLPICVGHEIVGHAVKIGSKVKTVSPGDRVGVGAQVWSCLECAQCNNNNEQYCAHQVDTYGARYPAEADPDETITQGGFSSHIRVHEYSVFPIPDAIPSHLAAPMLCAGLTTWSPLVRAGVGRGQKVAVVGFGGLGHFAVLWASALGAEVTVISHSPAKKDDALKMGARNFVISNHAGWAAPYAYAFDFVLNTADMTHTFDISEYLSLCNINATFHQVGVPDEPLPVMSPVMFMRNGSSIGASHIGSRFECLAMLKLAAEKKLFPMVETIRMSEEGCKEAVGRVLKNKVRYRFTLTDFDEAFKSRA